MKNNKFEVDLSNPKYSTDWLRYYITSCRYGLSFKTNLDSNKCNFNLVTDTYGLVNSGSKKSANVICGSSFGQGIGVDFQSTWFNKLAHKEDYFNISFPVGTHNHLRRLTDLYSGKSNLLFYLYHPNSFICSYMFYQSELKNMDIFKSMNWRTDSFYKYKLILSYPFRLSIKRLLGRIIYFDGYKLDRNYCLFNFRDANFLKSESANLISLFSKFEHVFAFKVPIKEELCNLKPFKPLKKSISENYFTFLDITKSLPNLTHFDLTRNFTLTDYHKYDNHWNESGNTKFVNHLKELFL